MYLDVKDFYKITIGSDFDYQQGTSMIETMRIAMRKKFNSAVDEKMLSKMATDHIYPIAICEATQSTLMSPGGMYYKLAEFHTGCVPIKLVLKAWEETTNMWSTKDPTEVRTLYAPTDHV